MTAASSPPTRALSRRAASAPRSASRTCSPRLLVNGFGLLASDCRLQQLLLALNLELGCAQTLLFKLCELPSHLCLAVTVERFELSGERRDPRLRVGIGPIGFVHCLQALERRTGCVEAGP